jgi:hypothetical protein
LKVNDFFYVSFSKGDQLDLPKNGTNIVFKNKMVQFNTVLKYGIKFYTEKIISAKLVTRWVVYKNRTNVKKKIQQNQKNENFT